MHTPVKNDWIKGRVGELVVAVSKPQSTIQHLLQEPVPVHKCTTLEKKTSRIPTSSKNPKTIAEKEGLKEEKADLKLAKQQRKKQEKEREKQEKERKTHKGIIMLYGAL